MSPVEFGLHIGERQPTHGEEDEGVIEEVGDLGDDALIPLPLDGENNFHGLLPHFLDDLVLACGEQASGVRAGRRILAAGEDDFKKPMEGCAHAIVSRVR
jgi:hypothetical protein